MTQPSPSVPEGASQFATASARLARTGLVAGLISVGAASTALALLFLLMASSSSASNDRHGYVLLFGTFLCLPFAAAAAVLAVSGVAITLVDPNSIAPRSRRVLQVVGFAVIGVNAILVAVDLYMFFSK